MKKKLIQQENPIGIVGLGLIGGSLGLELQALGYEVHGLVHRAKTAERARERKIAQKISTDPKILQSCQLIILALPLNKLLNPAQELINALPATSVITDVGSVKEPVLNIWNKLHKNFVGSHPMAGTTHAGVDAGIIGLFKNRPWITTPTSQTNPIAFSMVQELAMSLESQLISTDANKHDQVVGLISHLPMIISTALLKTIGEQRDPSVYDLCLKLASSGFEDTSRIGGGNPDLGTAMAEHNTAEILKTLSTYRWCLEQLEGAILSKNWNQLNNELQRTKKIRTEFMICKPNLKEEFEG